MSEQSQSSPTDRPIWCIMTEETKTNKSKQIYETKRDKRQKKTKQTKKQFGSVEDYLLGSWRHSDVL